MLVWERLEGLAIEFSNDVETSQIRGAELGAPAEEEEVKVHLSAFVHGFVRNQSRTLPHVLQRRILEYRSKLPVFEVGAGVEVEFPFNSKGDHQDPLLAFRMPSHFGIPEVLQSYVNYWIAFVTCESFS